MLGERHERAYSKVPCHLAITASCWALISLQEYPTPPLSSSSGPTQNFAIVNFPSLRIPLKEGIGSGSRPKDKVTFWITSVHRKQKGTKAGFVT
jgi:hypothetical protein